LFLNASTLLTGSVATMGLAFIQTLLLARALGPGEFGVWGAVQAYSVVVFAFLTFRTAEPVTRFLVEFRHQQDMSKLQLLLVTAVATDAGTRTLSFVAVMLSVLWFAPSLPGGAEALWIYLMFSASQVANFLEQPWFSVARDLGRYRTIASLTAGVAALRLAGLAGLWAAGQLSLASTAATFLAVAVIQMLVVGRLFLGAMRDGYGTGWRGLGVRALIARRNDIAGFWSFMNATFVWSIFSTLIKEGDVLVLGLLRPAEEVGWYRLAKSLAGVAQKVADMLAQVIYQDFSELVIRKDVAQVRRQIGALCRTWPPLVLAGAVVGMAIARPVVPWVFGVDYDPAIPAFRLLLLGSAAVTMLFWIRPIALAFDLYWFNLWVVAVSGVVLIPLEYLMIEQWGGLGCAAAVVLGAIGGYLALLVKVWPRLRPDARPGKTVESAGDAG
jgi:O-antigen/teichoic acid export membrane protein